ncbi:PhoH family protein [Chlamydia psittaci]|uniref:PhoH family protein n=1 Tax=Chlamydia psittaci TaxID=83554 RepID=UPI00027E5786|nr:PhoH family protein [Chlamydia psittaci]AFS28222.1 phoH-like family protein [Chlamydia psittaci NJ1]KPZ36065.1 ATPase [Chlamydia psittaci NJ1]MDS0919250.1 PhoH family protein [Chlamydia psittaci]MDS0989281.1 PhoH family protein [Chlamydia psittaci]MDS0995256.1 PhoH family protein [Chlamydia psittaci]
MKKTMVIDTSVFIYDPEALSSFENTRIIIPFTVIEELEAFAKDRDESAKNASRALSNIRLLLERSGNHAEGISLPNGSELRIEVSSIANLANDEKRRKLLTLELLQVIAQREPMVFVTKSLGRRVRAEALGIEARDYENKRFSFRSLYRGYRELTVSPSDVENFYTHGYLDVPLDIAPAPNEYFFISGGENYFALGRYHETEGRIVSLRALPDKIWGIKPLNNEQKCALDLLLRDDIKLVTLMGQAGSGKTVLALAAAMYQVFDKGNYNKLLVSRPIIPMGKDIGFLPGLKEEKLLHWMQPIYDNMEFLFSIGGMGDFSEVLQSLIEAKKLEMEALTYIRGRSLPKVFMIIDEAQNLTPHEIKTIISRAGKDTKIVLTGDPTQIDSLYFDENSNGLTYLVGKFHHLSLYGHMFLTRTERSKLAAAAATIL